jgi:hypothetical protein
LHYIVPRLWNSLPVELKNLATLKSVKFHVKNGSKVMHAIAIKTTHCCKFLGVFCTD